MAEMHFKHFTSFPEQTEPIRLGTLSILPWMGNKMVWLDPRWGRVGRAEMFGVTGRALTWESEVCLNPDSGSLFPLEWGVWRGVEGWGPALGMWHLPAKVSVRICQWDEMVPSTCGQSLWGQISNHSPRMSQLAIHLAETGFYLLFLM